jgi:hypothetical protein
MVLKPLLGTPLAGTPKLNYTNLWPMLSFAGIILILFKKRILFF